MSITNLRKLLLLGLLKNSDMHGYHLNAHLESNIPLHIKKPTAYNLLARMEQDGWIIHRSEYTGNRERRIYSLTSKGTEVFEKMLREDLSTFNLQEYPGLISMWLLEFVPTSERRKLLESRRNSLQAHLEAFRVQSHDGENLTTQHEGSSALVIEFVRRSLNLELAFLDEVIANLGSKNKE